MAQQIQLEIEGMSCDHCISAVRAALSGLQGVQVTDVRIGAATVTTDSAQVSIGSLIDAVQDAGYEARER
ncbi:MAG: heavy-metal-associated domain-containing protein [Gemmatimonadaceae bacterium]